MAYVPAAAVPTLVRLDTMPAWSLIPASLFCDWTPFGACAMVWASTRGVNNMNASTAGPTTRHATNADIRTHYREDGYNVKISSRGRITVNDPRDTPRPPVWFSAGSVEDYYVIVTAVGDAVVHRGPR